MVCVSKIKFISKFVPKYSVLCCAYYVTSRHKLQELYNARKTAASDAPLAPDMHPQAIFANNEMSLSDIEVIGFDYDYTLASYTPLLHRLLFDLGKGVLVNQLKDAAVINHVHDDEDVVLLDKPLKYPSEILNFKYDPSFAVRGLHFDTQKGLLMKIDSFHNIQLGTVFRGLRKVADEEVRMLYNGTHISVDYMNSFYGNGSMHQLIDLFAIPEISLISQVIEYFNENNIAFDPEYVFFDISNGVRGLHKSGLVHQRIMDDLEIYLEKVCETKVLLQELRQAGKKLFLISNSAFPFIDAGMKYMVGSDWINLFDIVIVNARKPKFFHPGSRPFRAYNQVDDKESWGRVTSLERGRVYQQGNLSELTKMTGWFGPEVLYFGDHVYSDLADPSLRYGWRTGGIIPELEREIHIQNTANYKTTVRWLVDLQQLIEEMQYQQSVDSKQVISEWLEERDCLRSTAKSVFNPYFGSLFRTHHNPTYFFRRLARFADIYTSSLTNMLQYPPTYTFYQHRVLLPHEPS